MTDLLTRAQRQLDEMLAEPVVNLTRASLMAKLILSAKEAARENETHNAYRDTYAIENAVDDLRNDYRDLNGRQILIEEIERIEKSADILALIVADLRDARDRQVAKLHQYQEAAE